MGRKSVVEHTVKNFKLEIFFAIFFAYFHQNLFRRPINDWREGHCRAEDRTRRPSRAAMNFCSSTIVVSNIRDSEQEIAIFFVRLLLIMLFEYVFNLVEILVTSFEAQRFFQNATIHQQCGNMGLPSLANNRGRKKDFRWQPQYNGFNVFLRLCFWISTLNSWNVFERWFLEFQIHPVWRLWVFVC